MGRGLQGGQGLVDRIQLVQGPVAARPGQLPGHVEGGDRVVGQRFHGGLEPLGVVLEQLVDPFVHVLADGSVGGEQPGVRQPAQQGQRGQVVGEGQPGRASSPR